MDYVTISIEALTISIEAGKERYKLRLDAKKADEIVGFYLDHVISVKDLYMYFLAIIKNHHRLRKENSNKISVEELLRIINSNEEKVTPNREYTKPFLELEMNEIKEIEETLKRLHPEAYAITSEIKMMY